MKYFLEISLPNTGPTKSMEKTYLDSSFVAQTFLYYIHNFCVYTQFSFSKWWMMIVLEHENRL